MKHRPTTETGKNSPPPAFGTFSRGLLQACRAASAGLVLAILLPLTAGAAVNAPTDFRTDPADFFDDGMARAVVVQFRWTDNATNETRYAVESSSDGVSFVQCATLPANSTGIDTLAVPWTSNRWFRVRAFNPLEVSAYSPALRVVGNMPPSHLAGSTTVSNQMVITWDTSGGLIDGYKVQQDTTTNFSGPNLVEYSVPGKDSASYAINYNFARNTVYYFRVLSTSIGGNSEAYNKPRAYLAVAPNGPPTPPIFVTAYATATSTNGQAPTEIRIIFDRDSLNDTGFVVQHSADSNLWVSVPFSYLDQTRQIVPDQNLLPGVTYFYRIAATNALGFSPWAIFQVTMPNVAPPGVTTWYIDSQATGNNDGTSWANAWRSMGAPNWTRLGPGHTVYISGGINGQVYQDYLVLVADGASNNPIVFKTSTEAGHNGRVIINGQIGVRSQWVTIDGSKSTNFSVSPLENIKNNINLEVLGRGDLVECINCPTYVGCKIRWVECHESGNSMAADTLVAVNLYPDTVGPYQCELAYCWIHDNWGSGVTQGANPTYVGPSLVSIHHNIIERNHNNQMVISRSVDIYNNIIRETGYPVVAHPDGIQGGIQDVRIYNNIIGNCEGSIFYPNLTDPLYSNLYLVNNFWYSTKTNEGASLAPQFSFIGAQPTTISNVVIAQNTFYGLKGVGFSVGNNGFINHLRAWIVKNNCFYSGPLSSKDACQFSPGGSEYPGDADLQFDYNIVCGPSKLIYYRENGVISLFPSAEALNAATSFKHNTSATPKMLSPANNVFKLLATDTVARGAGVDLSFLASQIPAITNDMDGNPRRPGWDIGAFQFNGAGQTNREAGLMLHFDFENDFYSSTSQFVRDSSGTGHDGLRFGRPGSMTNFPTPVVSYDASAAAEFHSYPNDLINYVVGGVTQYFTGDYIAVTNVTGINNLTNMTVAAWVNYYDGDEDADATIMGGGGANEVGEWLFGRFGHARTQFTISTNTLIPDDKFLAFPDLGVTNQWHLYAVTWRGANHEAIAYLDGVPVQTNTLALNVDSLRINGPYLGIACWTFDGDPWIFPVADGGNDNYPDNGWLHGAMDDLRLYNRALDAGEIQALYTSPLIPGSTSSLADGPPTAVQIVGLGTGSGTVISSPAGIAFAGGTCTASFPLGTLLTLTASPISGSAFSGWSGAASGTNNSFTFTVLSNVLINATFSIQDLTPPTVAITTPVSGATLAGQANVGAVASDNIGVVGVQLQVDGENLAPEFAAPPYNVFWNTRTVSDGIHLLSAVARDAAGNSTVSTPLIVAVTNSTLVLHFDFEQDFSGGLLTDTSGYGNNGIGYSLAHWPAATAGIVGSQAAFFSGTANPVYVAVTNWNGIDVLTNGTVSILARFSTNSYDGSTLLDAGDQGHPYSWRLGRSESANVKFMIFDASGAQQVKLNFPDDTVYHGVTPTFATTRWHQYAVTWDGVNVVGFYDGTPFATNSLGVPLLQIGAGGHWMAVGCRQRDGTPQWGDDPYPSSGWMGGVIDDLRIYNTFLFAPQVRNFYATANAGNLPASPSGLRPVIAGH